MESNVAFMESNVAFMESNVAFMESNVAFMESNVTDYGWNRSFAGPAGAPSGAAAASRNIHRNVLISESAGNPGISGVRSLRKRNAGYGKKT